MNVGEEEGRGKREGENNGAGAGTHFFTRLKRMGKEGIPGA